VDYLVVSLASLVVAALTLFSGFGLGTLLMPVFAIFFPVDVAVAATAVVHLLNNLFKLALLGKSAAWRIVALFGIPAALAAIPGAWLLESLSGGEPIASYELAGRACEVTPVKLVLATLIVGFALFDLVPRFRRLAFDRRLVPVGGAISGFFGGLSGHQGALRSAFLTKLDLSAKEFVGTSAVCAVIVDVVRLAVYGLAFAALKSRSGTIPEIPWGVVGAGSAAALLGSVIGARLIKKVTMQTIQLIVGALLIAVGLALGAGIV